MNQLCISTIYELRDRFTLFKDYPDIKFFEEITNKTSGIWMVDRTSTIQLPFRTKLLEKHRLPDLTDIESLSLEQCCMNRSRDLLTGDLTLYFLYSGGIDSTLALSSFIKAGAPRDKLIVVCNADSIRENPNFYHIYIKPNFNLMSSELFMQTIKTQELDGQVILCEPGDALYGQHLMSIAFSMFGGDYLEKPATRQTLVDFFKARGLDNLTANCCFDMYASEMSPRPIETLYDFFWWTHFNWRWQYNCEKLSLRTLLNPKIEPFYSTPEFQKWAVTHDQPRISTPGDFKKDYKQLIYDFTKDREYFNLKIKHTSSSYFYLNGACVAVDADGTRLKSKDFSLMDYYQPDNFISNWIKDNCRRYTV